MVCSEVPNMLDAGMETTLHSVDAGAMLTTKQTPFGCRVARRVIITLLMEEHWCPQIRFALA